MAARKTTIARVLVQHFRASLERLTGPLSDQAFASQVFGLYSGLVYFTPVFGGLLADRFLGQRRTVLTGAGDDGCAPPSHGFVCCLPSRAAAADRGHRLP
jgi:MFS family permease